MEAETNDVLSNYQPSNHQNSVGTHNEVSLKILPLLRAQGLFLDLPLSHILQLWAKSQTLVTSTGILSTKKGFIYPYFQWLRSCFQATALNMRC